MITIEEPITLYVYGRKEQFEISQSFHDKKNGFLIRRSVLDQTDIYRWDEGYYFYEQFKEVIEAISSGNLENGRIYLNVYSNLPRVHKPSRY